MITLFAEPLCPVGHAVRLVLAEKSVDVDVRFTEPASLPGSGRRFDAYGGNLTLIDRDLVLYEADVMMEYLEERHPHPSLMPLDPAQRATHRQLRRRLGRDLLGLAPELIGPNEVAAAAARRQLREQLGALATGSAQSRYFHSDVYGMLDCCLAPLLWRLGHFRVELPEEARGLLDYGRALFGRASFRASLSEPERRLTQAH